MDRLEGSTIFSQIDLKSDMVCQVKLILTVIQGLPIISNKLYSYYLKVYLYFSIAVIHAINYIDPLSNHDNNKFKKNTTRHAKVYHYI